MFETCSKGDVNKLTDCVVYVIGVNPAGQSSENRNLTISYI